ncbi:MAG: ribosomal protein S18-alanine N-acetyltransferase [Anaerolineales bacterium]|nr:ribosomal protein S18-alanine N-acetyltransferase [Anaerolineales bacterium]
MTSDPAGADPIQVVPMTLEDLPRVTIVDQLSFPLPWSTATYRYELLQNANSHFYVALAQGAGAPPPAANGLSRLNPANWFKPPTAPPPSPERPVVGYSGFWYILDEAHVSTIAVHPEWRGHGVGEHLFVHMLEQALDLGAVTATLEVRVTNERAQNLYAKYAFEVVGKRRRYYRDNGEDALLMTAELKPGYRDEMRRLFAARVSKGAAGRV